MSVGGGFRAIRVAFLQDTAVVTGHDHQGAVPQLEAIQGVEHRADGAIKLLERITRVPQPLRPW